MPSESTSRRIVENIAKGEENQMIYNFTNKDIFIVIDEAEVDGKKHLNILGGQVENPAQTVALESIILQSAPNQKTIVQHIDDCIRKLPIERKNFVLLLSDSASYDSRWKGIEVTLQQFISRYLCRASPSQLRRKNQKQV